jgi:hypothetical protein
MLTQYIPFPKAHYPLEQFTSNVGRFTAAEANDALLTVFGEISAQLHPNLFKEAKAVGSTILNRLKKIKRGARLLSHQKKSCVRQRDGRRSRKSGAKNWPNTPRSIFARWLGQIRARSEGRQRSL